MKIFTNEEFLTRMNGIDGHGIIEYIDKYKNKRTHIRVRNKYGVCKIFPESLFKGCKPSLRTAINKNEYYINMVKEVYGNKYGYEKIQYIRNSNKIIVYCKIHGDFKIEASSFLRGQACAKCVDENRSGYFNIKKAEINKEKWKEKECILYFIKCFNYNEVFYKIGITTSSVKRRFYNKTLMPYNYEVLSKIETNLYDAIYLEEELHISNSNNKYKPLIKFGGYTECFSKI